jgi:tetratricopeptide (TPR) repeat protein
MFASKPARRIVAVVVGLFLLGTALYGWRFYEARRRALAGLPSRPDLKRAPDVLRDRIQAAEQRVHAWRGPVRGLEELARLYHANGFLTPAQEAYRHLLAIEPSNARAAYLLATLYAGFGRLDEAVPLFRRTIELAPEFTAARVRLGDALAKMSQPREAADAYAALLKREPSHADALLGLARINLDAGKAGPARERLQQALQAHPNFTAAWALLASLESKLGNAAAAEAARAREQVAGGAQDLADPWFDELWSDCYDAYRLRVAAAAAPDTSSAERWLQRAIQVAPDDAAPRRQLGDLLTKQGDFRAAREQLERAVALGPKEADNWAYLLRLLDVTGDVAAGDRALATGLLNCPQSPSLHLERGRRLLRARHFEAALTAFETSRRLRPQEIDAYVELSTTYFRLNRIEEGVAALRSALSVEPGHPVALSALAFCAIGIGDEVTARRTLQEARAQPRVAREELEQLTRRFGERFGRTPW